VSDDIDQTYRDYRSFFVIKKFPLKFQYDTNQIFLTAYMTDSCHKLFSSCGQTSSSFAAAVINLPTMPADALPADALSSPARVL
jgi:hypothetical protein